MEITTIVRADRAYLAGVFRGSEETRYYLGGIYIHSHCGGVNIAATNGHTMGVFREDSGFTSEDLIAVLPKDCQSAIKSHRRDYESVWLVITKEGTYSRRRAYLFRHVLAEGENLRERLEAEVNEAVSLNELWSGVVGILDHTYPNYIGVIPNYEDKLINIAHYQPRYVKQFAEVANFAPSATVQSMSFLSHSGMSPVVIEISNREDFIGVAMPVKVDTRRERPFWSRKEEVPTVRVSVPEKEASLETA